MININEFRLGNILMQKMQNRVVRVACTWQHFELAARGEKDLYPLPLKAEILEQSGFAENKDYPLLPSAREFKLVVPVKTNQKNEILAYVKSNGECFARAVVNDLPASNNVHQLHQLQNLYFALTGEELKIELKK